MFMQVVFAVVCGDASRRVSSRVFKSGFQARFASLVFKSGRWSGDRCETRCYADRLQKLRFDDRQAESDRRGGADKSFLNRGIESLSSCFKRKNI
jgi:hypothetical protein